MGRVVQVLSHHEVLNEIVTFGTTSSVEKVRLCVHYHWCTSCQCSGCMDVGVHQMVPWEMVSPSNAPQVEYSLCSGSGVSPCVGC